METRKNLITLIATILIVGTGLYVLLGDFELPSNKILYYLFIGFSEEAIKILAILPIFWIRKDYKVFFLSAVIFAVIENFMYIQNTMSYANLFWRQTCILAHAGFVAIAIRSMQKYGAKGIFIGYIFASFGHSLYDILMQPGWALICLFVILPWLTAVIQRTETANCQ